MPVAPFQFQSCDCAIVWRRHRNLRACANSPRTWIRRDGISTQEHISHHDNNADHGVAQVVVHTYLDTSDRAPTPTPLRTITMDTTERDVVRGKLAELERWSAASLQEVIQKQQLVDKYNEKLDNFISGTSTETAQVLLEWRRVSNELRTIRNGNDDSSLIAPTTLPKVLRTQRNRVRLEEELCLLIRQPLFSQYEATIIPSQRQFFGITGPQGFGKSTFLHFLATKYCFDSDYLVVYLPACPTQTEPLKISLARAFYQGCQIAELSGYKELTRNVSLYHMLLECIAFAELNNKTLLPNEE